MSEQPETGEAPVPGAAPAPAPGLITRLEHDLAEARAEAARAAGVVLRIVQDSPVSSITVAGVTVTKDPSPVPAHLAGAVQEAAADAGVALIAEES